MTVVEHGTEHHVARPDSRRDMEVLVERQVRKVAAHVRARPLTTVALALFAAYFTGRLFRD